MRSRPVHIVEHCSPDIRSPKSNLPIARLDVPKPDMMAPAGSASVIPASETFDPAVDSLHASVRPIIILAQCFSLLPVSGVYSPDASHLRFTWRSPKILYFATSFTGVSVMTVFNIMRITSGGFDSEKMTRFAFYWTTLIAAILFLKLAREWPCLMLTWEKLEQELANRHRKVSRHSLSTRFKIMTGIVMTLALLEHTLSILRGYTSAIECTNHIGESDVVRAYFQLQFPQVFSKMSYSLWKGIVVDAINILSTFSWNFVDLFLILMSIALTDQFRQLNSRLYAIRGKGVPEWWWAEARNDYNHLATLTRRVDSHISCIVLLSFATNLYFICIQLLNSFNRMRDIQKIYFCFSLGFLLARTTAVSLYAAAVHDESLLPAPILYSVSGASYSTEVMRFLIQVTTDNISMTGMKFFSITRSLVLTVAGTIVTYELVLVQFNSVHQAEQSNITNICEVEYDPDNKHFL